ncbi:MAG: hypothetical protein INQ03_24905 [Candidatus Heimdallarchaeota archaeon]|nr:hypothetical protein [Candidatus Heimdallarchaeota archaeon]
MEYTRHKVYNPDVQTKISPLEKIIASLRDTDEMLQYFDNAHPDLFTQYLKRIENQISRLVNYRSNMNTLSLKELIRENKLNKSYEKIFEISVHFLCQYMQLSPDYQFDSDQEYTIATRISFGTLIVPRYYLISCLIDVMGRERGISEYKKYITHITSEPIENQIDRPVAELREGMIKAWTRDQVLDFAVYSFDDDMYVAKLENCIWFDALKDLGDMEIGYLSMCYRGPFMMKKQFKYVRQRRSVTLFDHDYCDELYWNEKKHLDPEHPSLEFLDKLKI